MAGKGGRGNAADGSLTRIIWAFLQCVVASSTNRFTYVYIFMCMQCLCMFVCVCL